MFGTKGFEPSPLWSGGPKPGEFYNFPHQTIPNAKYNDSKIIKNTMHPMTTGASVIGFVYDEGVVMAADVKGSYGSSARFMNIERIFKVTDEAVLGCGGDVADYQFIRSIIEQKVRDDECSASTKMLDAGALHCWLTRVLYNRRTKFDPLWLNCVVGGFTDDKPFIGFVDKIGTAYSTEEVATGFGSHLFIPMIREAREKKGSLNKKEAFELIHEAMKVLYYRDCTGHFKYQLADMTKDGVNIVTKDFLKETDWSVAYITSGH